MNETSFHSLVARLRDFIRDFPGMESSGDGQGLRFQKLALELFSLQFAHNVSFRRFCSARKAVPETVRDWRQIPAVPAAAFKELEMTCLPAEKRTRLFHSSGTTEQHRSRHFHNQDSLAIYEASLLPWFQAHLLGRASEQLRWLMLTPSSGQAPQSSLVHMFQTVGREFAAGNPSFAGRLDADGGWSLDFPKVLEVLRECVEHDAPVILLGTAFNFVHLLDHLAERQITLRLPRGSRVMETGGYKGRSRSLSREQLHALICDLLGVSRDNIVCEYGMSELSSQAYDRAISCPADGAAPLLPRNGGGSEGRGTRIFRFPPWVRLQIVSPETGEEVGEGETGLIRIFDLANVYSVMAIQTEDLGIRRGAGFEWIGRATAAEARGCSLMTA